MILVYRTLTSTAKTTFIMSDKLSGHFGSDIDANLTAFFRNIPMDQYTYFPVDRIVRGIINGSEEEMKEGFNSTVAFFDKASNVGMDDIAGILHTHFGYSLTESAQLSVKIGTKKASVRNTKGNTVQAAQHYTASYKMGEEFSLPTFGIPPREPYVPQEDDIYVNSEELADSLAKEIMEMERLSFEKHIERYKFLVSRMKLLIKNCESEKKE